MKTLRTIILLSALVVVGMQVHRPRVMRSMAWDRSQALTAQTPVPAHVQQLMRRACLDCHSNETRWPWYSQLAPASWMIANDVEHGRRALNFSEWGIRYRKPALAASMLAAACADVSSGNMPKARYLTLHSEARLSRVERDQFCAWAMTEATRLTRLRRAQPRIQVAAQ